jgi:hypothetical protein
MATDACVPSTAWPRATTRCSAQLSAGSGASTPTPRSSSPTSTNPSFESPKNRADLVHTLLSSMYIRLDAEAGFIPFSKRETSTSLYKRFIIKTMKGLLNCSCYDVVSLTKVAFFFPEDED